MRLLLICIVGWWASAAFAADGMSECAAIEQALERLRCYDRVARAAGGDAGQSAARRASKDEPASRPAEPPRRAAPVVGTTAPASAERPEPGTDRDAADVGRWFGREREPSAGEQLDHLTASILSVRKGPLGRQIISLSNGQVWMENEAGRRRIAAGQSVTIRKHRWHYELELPSQPNVAVRRID